MNKSTPLIATTGVLLLACVANADTLQMTGDGIGTIELNAGTVNGVLSEVGPRFRGQDLNNMHNALHSDGITTDGFITVVLAETDQGTSLFALVDDNTAEGENVGDSELGFSSYMNGDGNLYVNDINQDLVNMEENGPMTSVDGTFRWSSESNGDAIGWAGIDNDDMWSMTFTDNLGTPGMTRNNSIQFVTWNGDAWEVLAVTGFGSDLEFTFSSTVVPLPGAFAMGVAGLGGLALRRRRRQA